MGLPTPISPRRCTTWWAPSGTRPRRPRVRRCARRSGSGPQPCCGRRRRSRCSRSRSARCTSRATSTWRRRYERLGVEPAPFRRVRYYAPFKADGVNLNTLRTHPDLVGDVEPLVWGLREVLDYAEVLLNRDDIDAKADAFIDFLADRVVDKEFEDGFGGVHRVVTFADLERLFRSIFDGLELASRGGDSWRTHHIATMRKVRNRLANISTRCKGLVTDDGPSNDLPWGRFDDRTVYVVDLANVDPLGQDLVFARVVSQLRERLERRDLGVDAVVVFVDELNKYA